MLSFINYIFILEEGNRDLFEANLTEIFRARWCVCVCGGGCTYKSGDFSEFPNVSSKRRPGEISSA